MSTTNTTNLDIAIPVPGSGEPFLVSAYNAAISTLDGGVGLTICTSGTRPASPYSGQTIFETDSSGSFVYDGSAWQSLVGAAGGGFTDTFLLMGA